MFLAKPKTSFSLCLQLVHCRLYACDRRVVRSTYSVLISYVRILRFQARVYNLIHLYNLQIYHSTRILNARYLHSTPDVQGNLGDELRKHVMRYKRRGSNRNGKKLREESWTNSQSRLVAQRCRFQNNKWRIKSRSAFSSPSGFHLPRDGRKSFEPFTVQRQSQILTHVLCPGTVSEKT